MAQQQPQLTAAERVAQINKQLDSLDDDVFTLQRDVSDYAEANSWGGEIVKHGLKQIHVIERRIAELQEERRQLRAATQTTLAS